MCRTMAINSMIRDFSAMKRDVSAEEDSNLTAQRVRVRQDAIVVVLSEILECTDQSAKCVIAKLGCQLGEKAQLAIEVWVCNGVPVKHVNDSAVEVRESAWRTS